MTKTTSKERKLLKKLIKYSDNYDDGKIPVKDWDNYYLDKLIEVRLISRSYHEEDNEGNAIIDSVEVTNEGRHFFEWNRETVKSFILRNIFTPVIVSIITTGTLWFIGWLVGLVHLQ